MLGYAASMNEDTVIEGMTAYGLSRKTITSYLGAVRAADSAGIDLDSVTAVELRAYAETLPLTRSSRQLLRSAVLAYWKTSGREEGPARAIRVPSKPRMRCRALEDHPAAILAVAARKRGDLKGLAVLIGLYTALRRNEIATLRWADVDEAGWLTVVGKGDVTRTFPVHASLTEAFASHRSYARKSRRGHDWIFRGRWGGPVNPTTVWLWVRAVAQDAGLGAVPPHVLRHTALATALDNCHDLRAVQEFAGHAWPETTAGYTRVTRNRLKDAVGAIRYGEPA
jgi:site-specific recombinase XerD